jgi:hypothetical protein
MHATQRCSPCGHPYDGAGVGLSIPYPKLPTWVAPTVYNYTNTIELDGQVQLRANFYRWRFVLSK